MWRAAALACLCASSAAADTILSATYADPTTRYAHAILGDAVEYGTVQIEVGATTGDDGSLFQGKRSVTYEIKLPEDRVFEDLAPRLWDVTGDGAPEVVVILSRVDLGAALIVIGLDDADRPVQIAGTPHIGQTNRWLAPLGAADLDGDGRIEVAYIDRPHLAKTLRIWEFNGTDLVEEAASTGLTNHKIGEDFISGGIRTCGGRAEVITADADWTQIMASTFDGRQITSRVVGPFGGPASLAAAVACP